MSQKIGVRADSVMTKSLRPIVVAVGLGLVVGVSAVSGIAFLNGANWFETPVKRSSRGPFHNLKLRRLTLTRNLPPLPPAIFIVTSNPGAEEVKPKPPVPYLRYMPTPSPTPPESYNLSSGFMRALYEIAVARLERGGLNVPEDYMSTPDNPNVLIPTPEERIGPTNGELLLYVEATPDKQDKGTVIFHVSWELLRQVYLDKETPYTTPHKTAEGYSDPVRVWEKHLESAIIYELEKMIEEQIVPQYRIANPDTKGK